MDDIELQEVADIVEGMNADYKRWCRVAEAIGAGLGRRIDEEIMRVFGDHVGSSMPDKIARGGHVGSNRKREDIVPL